MSATKHRDLRTGTPVWLARRRPAIPHEELTRSLETEVVVVGAGISAAMVADALVEDGHEVVLLDRRGPLLGSTPATTALVQYEIDEPMVRLTRMIGTEKTRRVWKRTHQAIQNLAARIGELSIDCQLERRESLYLSGNVLDASNLKRECAARRLAGIETRYLSSGEVNERFGIAGRRKALLGYGNLEVEPLQLAAGLMRRAIAGGARLYAPVTVTDVKAGARKVTVATDRDVTVTCRRLIFCTGYEIPDCVPQKGHQIISTWALATKPQPRSLWPKRAFIWEASDPYLYMRTTPEGRVICGGEDEDFADEAERDARIPAKIKAIRAKLARLLPDLDTEPEFAWAANFGATATGLPLIGPVPAMAHTYALMGFGGNGITYSRIGAELMRAELAGTPDPDADLFAFPD